jgi:hypothetical protein
VQKIQNYSHCFSARPLLVLRLGARRHTEAVVQAKPMLVPNVHIRGSRKAGSLVFFEAAGVRSAASAEEASSIDGTDVRQNGADQNR